MVLKNNAVCAICGKGYYVCPDTQRLRTLNPWKSVVDSVEHYKIYMTVYGYTRTKDKAKAREELKNCDLDGLDTFIPAIKDVINEILQEDKEPVKKEYVRKTRKNVE